jgi:hypothetical protein
VVDGRAVASLRQNPEWHYGCFLMKYNSKRMTKEQGEETMDWPLLIIGTLIALVGLISIFLIWREQNPISQDKE